MPVTTLESAVYAAPILTQLSLAPGSETSEPDIDVQIVCFVGHHDLLYWYVCLYVCFV